MIDYIVGIVFCVIAFGFAYMSSHIIAERKAGKFIPLPWEKRKRLNQILRITRT